MGITVFAAACGDDATGGEPLPSAIDDGNGWRTVSSFPNLEDIRFWGDPILPMFGYWLGDNNGEVHYGPVWVQLAGEQTLEHHWFAFDAERTGRARPHELGKYDSHVYDLPDTLYWWSGVELQYIGMLREETFTGSAVLSPDRPAANRDLDIIVSADQYESSRGLYRGPVLFSKQFGATGVNGAPDRRELVPARDYTHSPVYFGPPLPVFHPV